MKIFEGSKKIGCEDASSIFAKIYEDYQYKFLLESREVSHIYGRMSLIGVEPVVEISGKNDKFEVRSLNERGEIFLREIVDEDLKFCDEFMNGDKVISGTVQKNRSNFEESERTRRKNISQIVRVFLDKFKQDERRFLGLFGAFSYDCIRLFEDLPEISEDKDEVKDFRLFLYDNFVLFDHLKNEAEVVCYRNEEAEARVAAEDLKGKIEAGGSSHGKKKKREFEVKKAEFEMNGQEYEELVKGAKELARQGELFEVVYSNTLRADFHGDPFALYEKYRVENPSPYLFYFDFDDEQLVGASPEMMVRCENGRVHMRPISGTAARGHDPIENHENMLELLSSEKERAELDMLIDLGRNDLARICEPGIEISDYRLVEQYSKVMHTVAHVTGVLDKKYDAFDSLIACMNAGTLTGAPKVAAMTEIEKNEKSRRGYYGGSVGYLSFSGNMDTGIIIRTAHIRDGRLSFRVGATLLYYSDPKAEYQETLNKAGAFLKTINYEE